MNDLTIKADKTLQFAQKLGVQNAIKPLEKEIFLQNVFVKDVFLHGKKLLGLKEGDTLTLKREPQLYDEWVVGVFNGEERIGELAEANEEIFAHLLDAGKKLVVQAKNIVIMPEYSSLEISIKMIDY